MRKNVREKGSFTVEAALIMPVILGIIVLFINAAMIFYDRCVIEYICQTACARAVYDAGEEEPVEEYIKRQLEEKLVTGYETDIVTDSDETSVMTVVTATVRTPGQLYGRTFIHKARAYKHFCPKY